MTFNPEKIPGTEPENPTLEQIEEEGTSHNEEVVEELPPEDQEQYDAYREILLERQDIIEKEAEKFGVIDCVHAIGKWYKKQPRKYKLAVSFGLIGVSATAAVYGAEAASALTSAVIVTSLCQRSLSSFSMFTHIETKLEKKDGAHNIETTQTQVYKNRTKAIIAAGAIFTIGDFIGSLVEGVDITPGVTEAAADQVVKDTTGLLATEVTAETIKAGVESGAESGGDVVDGIEEMFDDEELT